MPSNKDRKHDPNCALCRTNHPMMTYECAMGALNIAYQSIASKEAETGHLRRFKQGSRVHLSRAQVLEHIRIGFLHGECKPKDGKPAPCEHVFDDKQQEKPAGRLRDWE